MGAVRVRRKGRGEGEREERKREEGETKRDRHTDRQKDRQTDRQTERQREIGYNLYLKKTKTSHLPRGCKRIKYQDLNLKYETLVLAKTVEPYNDRLLSATTCTLMNIEPWYYKILERESRTLDQ